MASLVLILAGCWEDNNDSRRATAGLPSFRQDLEANAWVLDRADSSLVTQDANPVTLTISEDTVSGTGPCNAYRGAFDLDGRTVTITDIAQTQRACVDSTMKAEDEYLRALQSVDRARISDGRLVLSGGDARLTFQELDPAAALPGTWSVVTVATNDALVSPPAGLTPTVTFDGDETLTLTAGCNTGAGSWQVDGDAIAVDPIRLTTKHCDQPQGAMEQEAAIASAVEAASRIEITPTQLTLVDPQGAITLVATRPGSGS